MVTKVQKKQKSNYSLPTLTHFNHCTALSLVNDLGIGIVGRIEGDLRFRHTDLEVFHRDSNAVRFGLHIDGRIIGFGNGKVDSLRVILVFIRLVFLACDVPYLIIGLLVEREVLALRNASDKIRIARVGVFLFGLCIGDFHLIFFGVILPFGCAIAPIDGFLVLVDKIDPQLVA